MSLPLIEGTPVCRSPTQSYTWVYDQGLERKLTTRDDGEFIQTSNTVGLNLCEFVPKHDVLESLGNYTFTRDTERFSTQFLCGKELKSTGGTGKGSVRIIVEVLDYEVPCDFSLRVHDPTP